MSLIATAVKHLLAAGVTGDALVAAIAEMEACAPTSSKDASAARRREKDAAYQAEKRAAAKVSVKAPRRQKSADSADEADAPPPNDIYSNPPPYPIEAKASTVPFAEKVVEVWNDGPAKRGATKSRKLDVARRRNLDRRVKEHGEDGVLSAIRGIEISDFHCGVGPNAFTANLGWLLKNPEKFVAAMERADTAAPNAAAAPMNREQSAAYVADLAAKPWMRGREAELAQSRARAA